MNFDEIDNDDEIDEFLLKKIDKKILMKNFK